VLPLVLGDRISFVAVVLTLVAITAALLAARLLVQDRDRLQAVCLAVGASILLNVAAWGLVLPRLDSLWLSPRIAAVARDVAGCPDPVLVSVGFREMSLVFLAGTDTVIASPQQAADAIARTPCAVLAVDAQEQAETLAAIEAKGVMLEEAATETGRNIGNGDVLEMTLFRRSEP
jgi:hypothetical protein